jgi:integrase
MARNLTDRYIANLKPKAKRQHVFDTQVPGLCLRVSEGGKKTFTLITRINGKQLWRAVGPYGVLSLADAREQAREGLKRLAEGEREPFPEPAPDPETFEAIYRKFVVRHIEKKGLRSQKEIERVFEVYILPGWRARPIEAITRRDVADLLDQVEDTSGGSQADKVLSHLGTMFRWFATRDDHFRSPIVPGMRRTSPAEQARDRVLSADDIRALWPHLEGTFGALVKTLLLTGQRRAKVSAMRWADIVDGVWRISTEDREKGNAATLPLSALALEVIESQPRVCDFVFFGRLSNAPLRGFQPLKKKLDDRVAEAEGKKLEPWTLHDLRRSAKTLMQVAGTRPDISEKVLGHRPSGVEGTYDRHTYDAEKLDALERLAGEIDRRLNPLPDKVAVLRPRA